MTPIIRSLVCAATLVTAVGVAGASGGGAVGAQTLALPSAPAGTDLLLNAGAEAGAHSAQGWDAVTVPGWHISAGLPTVVQYGTPGFPGRRSPGPSRRGRQLFAGGAGGTAVLWQEVPLRTPTGRTAPEGTRYTVSAWLGGTRSSAASVEVEFLSARGRRLGEATIGPVGETSDVAGSLFRRTHIGPLPAGASAARVTLVLATTLRDDDGPNAPLVGYDRAVADNLSLHLNIPTRPLPPLAPPVAHVPRYQHVFLFYFENEDYSSVVGSPQAPYFNGLRKRGSLLADFFAEEHPSDANYLALAGGSAFGIPLDDPLEENPRYTIRAGNIGDLVDAAHESWQAYLQSADGPCDDTVHGYYWDDDVPMLYFADVRERPAYCSAHVVPLEALQSDLRTTATTPSFAWIGPDDCSDMEGCGIRAGDDFLASELGAVLRSPAWRTQRSLAIVTFDEDGYDYEHPAQRVATIVLASSGVRRDYVSHERYTHYSLLRTIEAALGLGTLTANDRYAEPVNDVFFQPAKDVVSRGRLSSLGSGPASPAGGGPGPAWVTPAGGSPGPARVTPAGGSRTLCPLVEPARSADRGSPPPGARRVGEPDLEPRPTGGPLDAYVVNSASNTVTPVDLATGKAGRAIKVGDEPEAIAVSPAGTTAYVVNSGSNSVTPIDLAATKAGHPIPVGRDPTAIALTPSTAYVVNSGSDSVTPIDLATKAPGPAIPVGVSPGAIALSPHGGIAYVLDWGGSAVTPIDTATNCALAPIRVGAYPFALAFTPDGKTAYVANYGSDTVTPITVATERAGPAISAGVAPDALAVTPNGKTLEVVDGDGEEVTPIDASDNRAGRSIPVGYSPTALAMSSGGTAYVANTISGTVTPITTATGHREGAISVGIYQYPSAIAIAPGGAIAVVVEGYAGQVTLIDTRTHHAAPPITVGSYPVAVAFGR